MPPCLNHRKTKNGCLRCKKRKVKCDEARPKCGACTRHVVECNYASPIAVASEQQASSDCGNIVPPNSETPPSRVSEPELSNRLSDIPHEQPIPTSALFVQLPGPPEADAQLETRLLHHFTAFASLSISPSTQIWQIHAPRLGFGYRFLYDAIMAVAALHLSRESVLRQATFPNGTAAHLREISHTYLNSALKGHREALLSLHPESPHETLQTEIFEAKYLASSLISLCTLCELGSNDMGTLCEEPVGESLWVTLVMGTRQIVGQWKQTLGAASWIHSKVFSPAPDLSSINKAELFNPNNGAMFDPLLRWATRYITLEEDDEQAYEHTLSYLGLVYLSIKSRTESPQSCCHRLRALPARVPRRFGVAVVQQQPLALVILAFVFAMMKLLDTEVSWFRGVAESQVRLIREKLPCGWRHLIQWPTNISNGMDVTLSINVDPYEVHG